MPKRKEELQDYLARWGAKAVPFSDAMGSSIFSTPDSEEALVLLDETAALRATMVLYGDNGVGKSLLIRSWLPTLDPKRYRSVVITHATLTGIGLMASLLLKLGCFPINLNSWQSPYDVILTIKKPHPPMWRKGLRLTENTEFLLYSFGGKEVQGTFRQLNPCNRTFFHHVST